MQTRKKHLIAILSTMAAAIILVVILSWDGREKFNVKNGFKRNLIAESVAAFEAVVKPKDLVDIVGYTDHHVFYKAKDPTKIYMTDLNLQNGQYIDLGIPADNPIGSRFITIVDSPWVSILGGNTLAVIRKQFNGPSRVYRFPSQLFLRATQISPGTFAFRGFDSTVKTIDPIFYKGTPENGSVVRERSISNLEIHDGGISTDGNIHYDTKTSRLIYTFHYSNQFVCMDTNMNLQYRGNTIDTFHVAQITAGKIEEKGILTNLTPPKLVNGPSCVADGYLFVNSKVKADNDIANNFKDGATIDVYEIKTGKYVNSFYIEGYKGEKVTKFDVIKDRIVMVYKSMIVAYRLPKFI